MGVGPIIGIVAIASVESTSAEREVRPPFALEQSGRMGDDGYKGSADETRRGLEDEEEAQEGSEGGFMDARPESTMRFVA